MNKKKRTRKSNKIIRGGSEAAALGIGALGGYTLGKKKEEVKLGFLIF